MYLHDSKECLTGTQPISKSLSQQIVFHKSSVDKAELPVTFFGPCHGSSTSRSFTCSLGFRYKHTRVYPNPILRRRVAAASDVRARNGSSAATYGVNSETEISALSCVTKRWCVQGPARSVYVPWFTLTRAIHRKLLRVTRPGTGQTQETNCPWDRAAGTCTALETDTTLPTHIRC